MKSDPLVNPNLLLDQLVRERLGPNAIAGMNLSQYGDFIARIVLDGYEYPDRIDGSEESIHAFVNRAAKAFQDAREER